MRPLWETYHLRQLLPWIDAHFRTLATRSQRAVAGVSMGGNGALHYAARHPDLFVAAASFSGANDVFHPILYPITETTEISNGATPGRCSDPALTQEVRWRASNPVDLAGNLGATWVSLAFGTGFGAIRGAAGRPDRASRSTTPTSRSTSSSSGRTSRTCTTTTATATTAGPTGASDLSSALPRLMAVFAQHRQPPSTVTYGSIDPAYSVFGWSVRLARPELEWSRLEGASARGFVLRGSGTAVIRTPAAYRPGARLTVTIDDAARPPDAASGRPETAVFRWPSTSDPPTPSSSTPPQPCSPGRRSVRPASPSPRRTRWLSPLRRSAAPTASCSAPAPWCCRSA